MPAFSHACATGGRCRVLAEDLQQREQRDQQAGTAGAAPHRDPVRAIGRDVVLAGARGVARDAQRHQAEQLRGVTAQAVAPQFAGERVVKEIAQARAQRRRRIGTRLQREHFQQQPQAFQVLREPHEDERQAHAGAEGRRGLAGTLHHVGALLQQHEDMPAVVAVLVAEQGAANAVDQGEKLRVERDEGRLHAGFEQSRTHPRELRLEAHAADAVRQHQRGIQQLGDELLQRRSRSPSR